LKVIVKILSLAVIIAGLFLLFRTNEIVHPPGILAPNEPNQKKLNKPLSWILDDYKFSPIATFELTARILSIKSYGSDDMSEFCPIDITLGWGKMSDQSVINKLDIKQQHRWYVWRTKKFPIPKKEIEISSSNIHIIPANENVEDILEDIIRGNIVSLQGKLVNVNKVGEKWTWKTSTERDDTGGGACEILWLERISIIK
jgi:hypothetical protein